MQTDQDLSVWLAQFEQAFPETNWDITTFAERSERIAERLGQIPAPARPNNGSSDGEPSSG